MKAKTFENLIRKIVREEIDYALRREIKSLKEDLRDELKPTITEQTKPTTTTNSLKNNLKEKLSPPKPTINKTRKIKKTKQNFTNNSTLNDLLNETAMSGVSIPSDANTSPVSLSQPFSSGAPMPVETAGMPESVANAVTRDYSSLMKAIIKKKKK
jgi:hypothetical protein